ncbi:MAG: ATPase [Cohaesibacter sp.]|jgi:chaperone required for assembly of F1-ATPase|nr:ATPase [Cohaesibacter sp.]
MADNDKQDDDKQALFGDFVPGLQDSTETPMMRAKEMMKNDLPKRFYKEVTIGEEEGTFRVLLDGRAIKSPAKKAVEVPKRSIAEALAKEWSAQTTKIDPATMPLTRLVNSVIDGVEEARDAMLDEIVSYLGNDFICYPASHPERLVARQKEHWQPVLDWAQEPLGGKFVQASGILAVEQSPVMGEMLRRQWDGLDIYQLGAVHSLMTLTGSALLPYAYWSGFLSRDEMWAAAMVDEDWNVEMWGEDDEATKRRIYRRADCDAAGVVIDAFTRN